MDTGELIWEEAKRLLARQEASLDALHTKALGLLSVSGIVAGLFAGQVLSGSVGAAGGAAVAVAISAFVVGAAGVLFIQWPRDFEFSHDLDQWVKELETGDPAPLIEATYNLSRDLNDYRKRNQNKITKLYSVLTWSVAALAVQVGAWALAAAL